MQLFMINATELHVRVAGRYHAIRARGTYSSCMQLMQQLRGTIDTVLSSYCKCKCNW